MEMPKWSEKEALEAIPKEQLIELFKLSAQLMLTIDGLWFVGAEKIMGVDTTMKVDEEVWRQFGALEANRMKKFLRMESVSTLEDVCKIVLLSPMWVGVGPQAEIENGRCYLSVTNCLPQKARIKKGLSELPCKTMGSTYFEGFTPTLDQGLKFKCIFCPPDKHPNDVWCKWEVGWF
jgi:hypothetical protein